MYLRYASKVSMKQTLSFYSHQTFLFEGKMLKLFHFTRTLRYGNSEYIICFEIRLILAKLAKRRKKVFCKTPSVTNQRAN